jgi:hypothetical protein
MVAYRPGVGGGNLTAEERATRQVKGILNKLTPEKFERLLQQLLGVITTADVLKSTIATVFENAVEQPTYCAMYAELCQELAKELPSFPPPPGEDKPLTFITILLNTCQVRVQATPTQPGGQKWPNGQYRKRPLPSRTPPQKKYFGFTRSRSDFKHFFLQFPFTVHRQGGVTWVKTHTHTIG